MSLALSSTEWMQTSS